MLKNHTEQNPEIKSFQCTECEKTIEENLSFWHCPNLKLENQSKNGIFRILQIVFEKT